MINSIFDLQYTENEKIIEIYKTIIFIMKKRQLLNNYDTSIYLDILKKNQNNINDETYIEYEHESKKKIMRIKLLYLYKISKISEFDIFLKENILDNKIIILNTKSFTAKIYNGIQNLLSKNENENEIEIFKDTELIFNLFELNIVPKYTVLSLDEKNKFLSDYDIFEKNKELPKIYDSDIICRYLNVKQGDILKIQSPNECSGYGLIYRIVIKKKLFEQILKKN